MRHERSRFYNKLDQAAGVFLVTEIKLFKNFICKFIKCKLNLFLLG